MHACRESSSAVKVYKNFKETSSLRLGYGAEGLHGGTLLAVRSADFVCFYDWATSKVRPGWAGKLLACWHMYGHAVERDAGGRIVIFCE